MEDNTKKKTTTLNEQNKKVIKEKRILNYIISSAELVKAIN